jgi:hypothetical protein
LASALGVTSRTVEHLKQRFVEEGLEAALARKPQRKPREVTFDGEFDARLTALACSQAPAGYTFQALATNLPGSVPPITLWRDYNGRAECEGVIKQLDLYFALDKLCLRKPFASEAAMSLAVVACNLCVLFQRHLGWTDRVPLTA